MMRQNELVDRVCSYIPDCDQDILNRAYVYAMHKHRHQTRQSGDPYFSHPLEVAAIVTDLKLDEQSVVAALLHDTIEDTDATRNEIDAMFGRGIGSLVDGLTKLKRIDLVSKKMRQGENLRRLLLAVADDVRVLLVKLADRLHNMRTLHYAPPEKRERIAQETLDIYAPLAGRMGMQTMRDELEDLAFQNLHPDAYSLVFNKLEEMRGKAQEVVREIEASMVQRLAEAQIEAQVKSRSKRPYSVFRKMERNKISFEQLSDVIGFRVIVDEVDHCYRALGVVHTRWDAVPERFKDYISTPKQNDYRSLHTTVIGPSHQRVEMQIRTHEMDALAEQGIAAHTLYKDGHYNTGHLEPYDKDQSKSYSWLRRTVDMIAEGENPDDVMEQARLELFHDQVFCFTPKGRLIALPFGATAIDFAYAVHTNVGNSCVGCRINGRAEPVVTQLKNGDEVYIIRAEDHVPPPAWEHIVATGKARLGIRRASRQAREEQYFSTGERMLETAFKRSGKTYVPEQLEAVLNKLGRRSVRETVADVGNGELPADDVIQAVFPDYQRERVKQLGQPAGDGWYNMAGVANIMFRLPGRRKERYAQDAQEMAASVPISGLDGGRAVKFDPDAGAVPGDRIIGILKPGEGVLVFPIQAEALRDYEDSADEWIDLRWDIDPENPVRFTTKIVVTAINQVGVLAEISEIIARCDSNIANLFLTQPDSGITRMVFGIEVWDLKHLTRVIRELRTLSVVSHVDRFGS
ncbi:MAG: bifunctional (p)ppGpp synthetase/guanosine-3',5'-bis(diphosphate) 3'-pyrophosphohydrolase [Pseudomonadota bacterium]